MKRSSFNVLFFLKKTKLLKNGEASVCMRITVDGTRVENNIRKSIDPSLWSQAKESARGKSRKSCDLNAYIENARIKLHQIFCELEEQNQPITARLLQEIFFGQDKEPEAVRTCSWYVQSLYGHNTGTNVVPLTMDKKPVSGQEGQNGLFASAVWDENTIHRV